MHDMSRRSRGAQRRTDDLILFHKPVERATSFKTAQPAKGKLRQQPAKPTSVFHDVPFSHWPISPLLKDNRTNNGPPPQPLTSNTPLLVRCVGVFQKVHTLLYKSLEPPIISVLNVSCRSCGCPALLVCLGSLPCWSQMDPNQSAPFCHSFCSAFVQLQGHTAQHDGMMALVLV